MNNENGNNATFLPLSSSDVDVDVQNPNNSGRSRISYTRKFLLSLANGCSHSTVKLPRDVELSISCMFQDSTGLLSPPHPLPVPDSKCQINMPQKISLKVPDDVNLHRSIEPYRPPRRHKALPPSTRDSNDSLSGGDTSGSSECTDQDKTERGEWRKGVSMEENTTSPDVKVQQELELNSSNIMLHENSDFSSQLCLPDEDSLIIFDEPFLMPEVENSAVSESSISSPESIQVEDDLLSPNSPHDWAEKLVQSILDDDNSPDPYMDDPMMHYGAGLDPAFFLPMYSRQSYTQLCSNQLNPGWDQQDHSFLKGSIDPDTYSLFSNSHPFNKIYQPFPVSHDGELFRRFDHEVSQTMFQQMINPGPCSLWGVSQSVVVPPQLPELQLTFCTENLNTMQSCLEHKKRPSYADLLGRRNSGSPGEAAADRFDDRKLRATL